MILIRLLLLPIRLALGMVRLALKTGFRAGLIPFKVTGRSLRVVGIRGTLLLAVGVIAGFVLAPESGREFRAKIHDKLGMGGDDQGDLGEKVAFELAHAPRTWHLDQPEVAVADGRVTLRGTVGSEDARAELGRVAAAVPGVQGVDNLVVVKPSGES